MIFDSIHVHLSTTVNFNGKTNFPIGTYLLVPVGNGRKDGKLGNMGCVCPHLGIVCSLFLAPIRGKEKPAF